tara:strand:- start:452 stop:985 length:534 start_codon:yes stop_codon:yes gene_type:complete
MSHTEPLPSPVALIRLDGIFDFKGLYEVMHSWFVDRGYFFEETLYKHKVPSPAGAEQTIEWSGWKKVNEYIKYWIEVHIKIRDMKQLEVVKEGEKRILTKGRLRIEFDAHVEADYANRFNGSKFLQKLQDIYLKYIIKSDLDFIYTDQLWYVAYKLHRVTKEFLDFDTKGNAFYDVW